MKGAKIKVQRKDGSTRLDEGTYSLAAPFIQRPNGWLRLAVPARHGQSTGRCIRYVYSVKRRLSERATSTKASHSLSRRRHSIPVK